MQRLNNEDAVTLLRQQEAAADEVMDAVRALNLALEGGRKAGLITDLETHIKVDMLGSTPMIVAKVSAPIATGR